MSKVDKFLSSYSQFSKTEIILKIKEITEKMFENKFSLPEQAEVMSRILYQ